jgi:hypothetical protein
MTRHLLLRAAAVARAMTIPHFATAQTAPAFPPSNGGGIALGNEKPTMDKLASEGLVLTSAYSTPSCSPSRATYRAAPPAKRSGGAFSEGTMPKASRT